MVENTSNQSVENISITSPETISVNKPQGKNNLQIPEGKMGIRSLNISTKQSILFSLFVVLTVITAKLATETIFFLVYWLISINSYEGKLPIHFSLLFHEPTLDFIFLLILFILFSNTFIILKFPRFAKLLIIIESILTAIALPTILMILAFGGIAVPGLIVISFLASVFLILYKKHLLEFKLTSFKKYFLIIFLLSMVPFLAQSYESLNFAIATDQLTESAEFSEYQQTAINKFGTYNFSYLTNGMKKKNADYARKNSSTNSDEIENVYSCKVTKYIPNDFWIRGTVDDTAYKYGQKTFNDFKNGIKGEEFTTPSYAGETVINNTPAYYYGSFTHDLNKDQIDLFFAYDNKYWRISTYTHCLLPENSSKDIDIVNDQNLRKAALDELIKVAASLRKS